MCLHNMSTYGYDITCNACPEVVLRAIYPVIEHEWHDPTLGDDINFLRFDNDPLIDFRGRVSFEWFRQMYERYTNENEHYRLKNDMIHHMYDLHLTR